MLQIPTATTTLILSASCYIESNKATPLIFIATVSFIISAAELLNCRPNFGLGGNLLYKTKLWLIYPSLMQTLVPEELPYLIAFSVCYMMILIFTTNTPKEKRGIDEWVLYAALCILTGHSVAMLRNYFPTIIALMITSLMQIAHSIMCCDDTYRVITIHLNDGEPGDETKFQHEVLLFGITTIVSFEYLVQQKCATIEVLETVFLCMQFLVYFVYLTMLVYVAILYRREHKERTSRKPLEEDEGKQFVIEETIAETDEL